MGIYKHDTFDDIVIAAADRFNAAWKLLLEKTAPLVSKMKDAPPSFAMWEVLGDVAETDDERLIAALFVYNVDDAETSVSQAAARVRNLYVTLSQLELDPIVLKQQLNEPK